MNLLKYILLLIFLIIGCKSVLDTGPTDKNLFDLTVEFDSSRRIVDTLTVKLSWSDITIENFKKIKLVRYNNHRDPSSYLVGTADNGWVTILDTDNPFVTTWIDTIRDDADFIYRVDYIDAGNNYRRAESQISTSPTTHITIPTDVIDIKGAVESFIMDDGDSVIVLPGLHSAKAFSYLGKNISVLGTAGAWKTSLEWVPSYGSGGKLIHDSTFIKLNNGLIQGLAIRGGIAYHGGGINASGNAEIRQCRIKSNSAGIQYNGGLGGGLYLSGRAKVVNCMIDSNYADKKGSGIYVDEFAEDVKIINCTLANNNIYCNSPNVVIMNTSVIDSPDEIHYGGSSQPTVMYSYAGEGWAGIEPSNISGDVGFISYDPLDPHLHSYSVCVDSGNPGPIYNDLDGSRNDIGVYGGPFGE